MRPLTRRQFIEDSLLAATAAAASRGAPAAAQEPPKPAAPSERLRVAVVGVRGQGSVHVVRWCAVPGVEIATLCDVDSSVTGEVVRTVEKKSGKAPQVVPDLRKMLEDKSIDVVSIATPNHWHCLAAVWAIQAGKDVYVEKPLGHNIWEQQKLVEAARKRGRLVQHGTYPRSYAGIRAAMDFLRAGKIGKITGAHGICYNPRQSIGKKPDEPVPAGVDYNLWLGPAPERPFNRNRFHYNWHWNWDFGGGELANNGVYQIDQARWAIDKNEMPRRVLSLGGRFGYEDDGQTPNTQVTLFDWGDLQFVHEVRGLRTEQYQGFSMGTVVRGTEGYLVSIIKSTIAYTPKGEVIQDFKGEGSPYQNFFDAIKARDRKLQHNDVQEGHLSGALCHLGNISYRTGEARPLEGLKEPFGACEAANETYLRFSAHLKENGADLSKTPFRMGRWLEVDPAAEKAKDPAAQALFRREYRKPFEVPEQV
jgi:predicted dehydrogenase